MEKKKATVRIIPLSDEDFIVLGRNVLKVWQSRPQLNLLWADAGQLETSLNLMETSFNERKSIKGERSVVTVTLRNINAEINQSIRYIKDYLVEQYTKKEAPAYYTGFGIVKKGKGYGLPDDKDKRLYALQQLVLRISASEFRDKRYGYTYWKDLLTRFEETKSKAFDSDSATSQYVNVKGEQKVTIRRMFNSLIKLIQANYPLQWREELRVWGFQKEKY